MKEKCQVTMVCKKCRRCKVLPIYEHPEYGDMARASDLEDWTFTTDREWHCPSCSKPEQNNA